MLTLKDFIKETLTQITEATTEFHTEQGDRAKVLGPQIHAAGKSCVRVDFDVAVTAEESSRADGGVAVKVLSVISATGEVEKTNANSSDSRVSFQLALYLPDVE